jgi:15-cis-phytoene synthase
VRPEAALLQGAEQAIAQGSRSFASAARLFDRHTRESVVMLYAWCRHCDDVVDGQQHGFGQCAQEQALALQRVEALREDTLQALRGGPVSAPPFAALAEVVRRHRIPHRFPLEHLSGYGMDASARHYASLADTLDYCYRVAGVVGMMMAMVMGACDDATLDRAADLGLAFQLTNIARDVIDDHAAGRLYLPADWLAEEGIAVQALAHPQQRAALARVACRLVDAAEPYYVSARVGLASLPLRSAWAVAAARGVYREIGHQVRARGDAAWDERVITRGRHKLRHVLTAAVTAAASKVGVRQPVGPPLRREGLWTRPGRHSRA